MHHGVVGMVLFSLMHVHGLPVVSILPGMAFGSKRQGWQMTCGRAYLVMISITGRAWDDFVALRGDTL